jgi:hypothetical protein
MNQSDGNKKEKGEQKKTVAEEGATTTVHKTNNLFII